MSIKSSFASPAVVAMSFCLIGGTVPAVADILHVPGDYPTIQAAIDAAQNGDEVVVATGTYPETISFIGKAITVRSSGGPDATIIDAQGSGTVVTCTSDEGTDSVLQGFTITGGTGTLDPDFAGGVFVGGGMYNNGTSPTVTNCIFTANNGAHSGGGMFNRNSSPTVSDCTFSQNAPTQSAGGMYNFDNSSPTVTGCDFIENVGTADGAGMYNHTNSSPIVANCTFSGNSVIGGIGGQDGGGMVNANNSNPMVTNCTFTGNIAGLDGGGMMNSNSSPVLSNCTFSGNTAGTSGGGLHNENSSMPTVADSSFCENTPNHISGDYNDGGGNVFADECDPVPPFLQLETPDTDLELQQGQQITISWLDDGQAGAEIRLYFDPDTGETPWDEGGNNEIWMQFSIDASSPVNELTLNVPNLPPGTYSIWGKSDNGVHEPAYSRAPGLLTVEEFTEDTQPEVDEDRIDLESFPNPVFVHTSKNPTNLFLVTHGWNGLLGQFNNHSWIEDVAWDVKAHVDSNDNGADWDIAYYNWHEYAGGHTLNGLNFAADYALIIGQLIAESINDKQFGHTYEHIEVIAHSAGSWMGYKIARRLEELGSPASVNLTLLDAFVNPAYENIDIGLYANHVANFYDDGFFTPGTQENFTSAFNVDMSCRHDEYSDCLVFTDHCTPRVWYAESAALADGTFIDDGTYCPNAPEECFPLGFKMSKAYDNGKQWDISAYPNNGNTPFVLDCDLGLLGEECSNNTSVFVHHSDTFDFTTMQSAVGDDGAVTIAVDNVELTTGVETAWVGFDVPIDRTINAVLFDVEFTSEDRDAEGYATAYWVGAQLSGSDERFADENTPSTSSFLFFETIPPGERVISFRLDANGGPTSSVRISNLRIGMFIEGDINGDCVLSVDDFCAWVANPFDIDGNGVIDDQDQTLLAMALGVSEADDNNNGIPDVCDCTGDLDGDGSVGAADLLTLLANWGPCKGCPADLDGDGSVGASDLLTLLANWGPCP